MRMEKDEQTGGVKRQRPHSNRLVLMDGSAQQRLRAKKYVRIAMCSQQGWAKIDVSAEDDGDLTLLACPEESRTALLGQRSSRLLMVSEETGAFVVCVSDPQPAVAGGTKDGDGFHVAIFGDWASRCSAQLRLMFHVESARDASSPAHYKLTPERFSRPGMDWEYQCVALGQNELGQLVGTKGEMRMRLRSASGCIVEFIRSEAHVCGPAQNVQCALALLESLRQSDRGVCTALPPSVAPFCEKFSAPKKATSQLASLVRTVQLEVGVLMLTSAQVEAKSSPDPKAEAEVNAGCEEDIEETADVEQENADEDDGEDKEEDEKQEDEADEEAVGAEEGDNPEAVGDTAAAAEEDSTKVDAEGAAAAGDGVDLYILAHSWRLRKRAWLRLMSAMERRLKTACGPEDAVGIAEGDGEGMDVIKYESSEIAWISGKLGNNKKKLSEASGCDIECRGERSYFLGSGPERRRGRDYVRWLLLQLQDGKPRERTSRIEPAELEGRDDVTLVPLTWEEHGTLRGSITKCLNQVEVTTSTFMFFREVPRSELLVVGTQVTIHRGAAWLQAEVLEAPADANGELRLRLLGGIARKPPADVAIDPPSDQKAIHLMILGQSATDRARAESLVRAQLVTDQGRQQAAGNTSAANTWGGASSQWESSPADTFGTPASTHANARGPGGRGRIGRSGANFNGQAGFGGYWDAHDTWGETGDGKGEAGWWGSNHGRQQREVGSTTQGRGLQSQGGGGGARWSGQAERAAGGGRWGSGSGCGSNFPASRHDGAGGNAGGVGVGGASAGGHRNRHAASLGEGSANRNREDHRQEHRQDHRRAPRAHGATDSSAVPRHLGAKGRNQNGSRPGGEAFAGDDHEFTYAEGTGTAGSGPRSGSGYHNTYAMDPGGGGSNSGCGSGCGGCGGFHGGTSSGGGAVSSSEWQPQPQPHAPSNQRFGEFATVPQDRRGGGCSAGYGSGCGNGCSGCGGSDDHGGRLAAGTWRTDGCGSMSGGGNSSTSSRGACGAHYSSRPPTSNAPSEPPWWELAGADAPGSAAPVGGPSGVRPMGYAMGANSSTTFRTSPGAMAGHVDGGVPAAAASHGQGSRLGELSLWDTRDQNAGSLFSVPTGCGNFSTVPSTLSPWGAGPEW